MSKFLSALVLVSTGMLVCAWAQQVSASYRLQPEDRILITVYGEDDMTVNAPIGFDGTIAVPFLGFIKVAGMTPGELESHIYTELKRNGYFVDPKVTVNIVQFRALRASAVGAFIRPGQYEFRPGDRLLALISQAQGTIPDRSDRRHATLIRRGTVEQIPLDMQGMLDRGDLSQNYELQDGDIINLPETAENRINVIGYVARPGQFGWREGLTLADALAQAGGEIPYRSRLSAVQIQRMVPGRTGEFKRFKVDFTRFTSKNDFSQNVLLEAGDIIYVPSSKNVDTDRISQLAGIAFTIQALTTRNFSFFPRF